MLKPLDNYRHFAVLLVRASLGALFLIHGGQKLFGWWGGPGPDGFVTGISGMGLPFPTVMAWAAMLAEFAGGIALLLGVMTRFFALGILVNMVVAIWKVHLPNGLLGQGGYELPLFYGIVALSFVIGGAGRYSIDGGFAVERK